MCLWAGTIVTHSDNKITQYMGLNNYTHECTCTSCMYYMYIHVFCQLRFNQHSPGDHTGFSARGRNDRVRQWVELHRISSESGCGGRMCPSGSLTVLHVFPIHICLCIATWQNSKSEGYPYLLNKPLFTEYQLST